jgi:hypothetical protein
MVATTPQPLPRPALARFIWERDLDLKTVGDALGCSYEQVRRICLPFGDTRRRVPAEELMARIVKWTNGEVKPVDFYSPHLNEARPGDTAVLAAGRAA